MENPYAMIVTLRNAKDELRRMLICITQPHIKAEIAAVMAQIEGVATALDNSRQTFSANPLPVLRELICAMGLPRLLERCEEANASLTAAPGALVETDGPDYWQRISGTRGDERDQT